MVYIEELWIGILGLSEEEVVIPIYKTAKYI